MLDFALNFVRASIRALFLIN